MLMVNYEIYNIANLIMTRTTMNLTKKEMGEALKQKILNNISIEKIANWAYEIYINSRGNLSPEVSNILQSIF